MDQIHHSGEYLIQTCTHMNHKKGKKMGCKVYGVIAHVHFACCYLLFALLPGGTKVTIKCLHRNFLKLHAQEKQFPPRLYVKLDNTSKDNKSRFVVACLYVLVCCGCFGKIDIFSFKVGHTHCNADQLFSQSSIYLRDKDIWNFEQLCHHLFNPMRHQ